MEKTDVQRQTEDEVRRIMRERGFETTSESGSKKKHHDFNFSIVGKALVTIAIIGGLPFGILALSNSSKSNKTEKDHGEHSIPDDESKVLGIEQQPSDTETAMEDTSISQPNANSSYGSTSQQTTAANQPANTDTSSQDASSNYTAPDCSTEEREVEIRKALAVYEEQQYNDIFNNRKSYSELVDQANDNLTYANILYTEQKARIDAAWQVYLDAQAAYQSAYDDMLNCERR